MLQWERNTSKVCQLPRCTVAFMCKVSDASLLPCLVTRDKSETLTAKIMYDVKSQIRGCAFTLISDEPNLSRMHVHVCWGL